MDEDCFLFIRQSFKPVDKLVITPYTDLSIFLNIDPKGEFKEFYIPEKIDDLILVCYGRKVNQQHIMSPLVFNAGLMFNSRQATSQVFLFWKNIGIYRNKFQTPNGTVRIYPDGTYSNDLKLNPIYGSDPITGLNMMLPVEYGLDLKESPQ
jgi:hypothetical protein